MPRSRAGPDLTWPTRDPAGCCGQGPGARGTPLGALLGLAGLGPAVAALLCQFVELAGDCLLEIGQPGDQLGAVGAEPGRFLLHPGRLTAQFGGPALDPVQQARVYQPSS